MMYDEARAVIASRIDELEARQEYFKQFTMNTAAGFEVDAIFHQIRALKKRLRAMENEK